MVLDITAMQWHYVVYAMHYINEKKRKKINVRPTDTMETLKFQINVMIVSSLCAPVIYKHCYPFGCLFGKRAMPAGDDGKIKCQTGSDGGTN